MSATPPVVRVSVQTAAGLVLVRAGHSRITLSPVETIDLAGRLEIAAVAAERQATG